MVHTAYDSFQLISDSQTKIDAVESYGSNLLLACSDGSLRIYCPQSSSSSSSSSTSDRSLPSDSSSQTLKKESYVLERTINGFSRRPMLAMEVLGSRELLLSLSESIALHRLPNLETTAVITKAKGANVYAWDDRRGFLCFARQKRVFIFRHEGGRGFVEVKEFGVPDTVKSMAWCGENICLGLRREYTVLNASNGTLSEVFSSGRTAPPLVVSISSGELLLGKDNIGVFVDQNGKLLQEGRICWSEAPSTVVIQKPYAIGLLPRHVEIRSLQDTFSLVQTFVLRNVRRLIHCSGAIIVSLDNSVHALIPVPLGAQIIQLTASGNFEEALALCRVLPPEDSNLRASKEQSIHIRYAHYLFDNGSYEEAMDHFLESQVDLTYVLSLFPYIVLPKSSLVAEPDKLVDVAGDASFISRGSSGLSDDMESPHIQLLEPDENTDVESKKVSHNTLMALIKYLQKKRNTVIEKAAAEGTEEVVLDAVGSNLVPYGNSRSKKTSKGRGTAPISSVARAMASILDTALLQALILAGQCSAALALLKGLNYCDVKICEDFLLKRNQYLSLMELYKCNGMHHEALKLLHRLVEESKSDEPQMELTQKFTPEMIIEYLQPLCATQPELVLEYSMLVLETCPALTIELYLSGNIPADWVNSYLKQNAPKMQATYLELMLAMNENNISGNLQNEMVQIYLSEVLDWYHDLSSKGEWDEKTFSTTRKKLLSALENISGYSPVTLLRRLPADALYEERAILLGKMNQHELALSIYVHKLHVPELALSYCDRIHESVNPQHAGKAVGNIYLTLLQIYLNPQKSIKTYEKRISKVILSQNPGSRKVGARTSAKTKGRASKKVASIEGGEDTRISQSGTDSGRSDVDADEGEEGDSTIMLDQVLDLLSKRWDRMHGAQALKLLPKETKLQNLISFLCPLLRKSSEAYRNCSVIKSLRESENLQVKDELYNQRKTVVKITGDSMCSLCHKKIGTSVFAVYPNGKTIVHFVCFRDTQNMKAIGKGSLLQYK